MLSQRGGEGDYGAWCDIMVECLRSSSSEDSGYSMGIIHSGRHWAKESCEGRKNGGACSVVFQS